MKDKILMMYNHIRSAVGVDTWAIDELRKVLEAYTSEGCTDCVFEDKEEWEFPCTICKRNYKDYWRAEEED